MSKHATVLVIDDEPVILEVMGLNLTNKGHAVLSASSGNEGLNILADKPVDTVLVDYKMPGMNGLEFLERCKNRHPDIPVIMMTAHGSIEMAVEAMRKGAFSYLAKPLNHEEMLLLVQQAIEKNRLIQDVQELHFSIRRKSSFENIITNNQQMLDLLDMAVHVAETDSAVLIHGETGTGKSVLAKAIHYESRRAQKRFAATNCAALPDALLESELFGHVKGAFTGAVRDRKGRFETAHAGTLFLDEIGDISPNMQAKLLRVLETMEFERLGSDDTIKVDVRIIAATNRDLEKAIADGAFREDLFFRLNVIPFYIPPLRERKDDIALLADHYLEKSCAKLGKTGKFLSPSLMRMLLDYDWPGNVRELQNNIERAIIFSKDERLQPEHFTIFKPYSSKGITEQKSERELLIELEQKYADYPNTLTMIAKELRVDTSTIYRKRKKYGLL